MNPWLRFFRVVNLPTVPGDVLVGAAAAGAGLEAFTAAGAAAGAAADTAEREASEPVTSSTSTS